MTDDRQTDRCISVEYYDVTRDYVIEIGDFQAHGLEADELEYLLHDLTPFPEEMGDVIVDRIPDSSVTAYPTEDETGWDIHFDGEGDRFVCIEISDSEAGRVIDAILASQRTDKDREAMPESVEWQRDGF